jgi:hypothetical protein
MLTRCDEISNSKWLAIAKVSLCTKLIVAAFVQNYSANTVDKIRLRRSGILSQQGINFRRDLTCAFGIETC